jgi:hypothetical protein
MAKIKGYMEWDNDSLTPGNKREGGLHQNLYDDEGNLKGSARFVPLKEDEFEPIDVTENMYIPVEERRKTPEEQALEDAIAELLVDAIENILVPFAKHWWGVKGRPFINGHWSRFLNHVKRNKHVDTDSNIESPEIEKTLESIDIPSVELPKMSSGEAQARYLAALAAKAYSDEQLRLIANAEIVGDSGDMDWGNLISQYPPEELKELLKKMASDPMLLTEGNLAQLASILGRNTQFNSDRAKHLRLEQ